MNRIFKSSIADDLHGFLQFKRNLGFRYAHDDGFVPGGCFDAADPPGNIVFPAACRPTQRLAIYSRVVPRLHAA